MHIFTCKQKKKKEIEANWFFVRRNYPASDLDQKLLSIDEPADQLFQNFAIQEVRSIKQRARNQADQKREDLRKMVGERHHDLLRAELKSKAQLADKSQSRSIDGSSSKLSYILATLVRLLSDLSEHIWCSLEQEDFLTPSRYESLGRMITIKLSSGNWDESRQTQAREVIEMFKSRRRSDKLKISLSWMLWLLLSSWIIPPSKIVCNFCYILVKLSSIIYWLNVDEIFLKNDELHQITHAWFTTCQESLISFINQHLILVQSVKLLFSVFYLNLLESGVHIMLRTKENGTDKNQMRLLYIHPERVGYTYKEKRKKLR
ncbi:hypothetical protein PSTT_02659 [Puccinia striiformis]|uniref:Conserved oligomeric Golgi complex subunit 1 n=1 Tax=Puccinia striiformis TaxID=27350 RepID=A0A2S4VZ74_9BASI|nr:hypothetical protein PSTT_02659 [Puccinia striiformis]